MRLGSVGRLGPCGGVRLASVNRLYSLAAQAVAPRKQTSQIAGPLSVLSVDTITRWGSGLRERLQNEQASMCSVLNSVSS